MNPTKEQLKIKLAQKIPRWKKWMLNHPEKVKQKRAKWFAENKAKTKQQHKQWCLNNKQHVNLYRTERYKTNLNYRISCLCRARIKDVIKGFYKSDKTAKLIMCSIPEFKLHIEKQWLPGMSWENWGFGIDKWVIDHIIPCSFFDMSDAVEQHMCFRWQNLQPLWWKDNLLKSDKIITTP